MFVTLHGIKFEIDANGFEESDRADEAASLFSDRLDTLTATEIEAYVTAWARFQDGQLADADDDPMLKRVFDWANSAIIKATSDYMSGDAAADLTLLPVSPA